MSSPTTPAPAPLAAEPEQPALSQAARIINTFIAPQKTFTDIRRNASWWVPWLIAAIFSILMAVVIVQKVDLAQLAQKRMEMTRMGQTQLEQMPPAQKERVLAAQVIVAKIQYFARPVLSLIGGLLAALILMVIFNFGFAAEIPFSHALAVVFYAWLPGIVKSVLVSLGLLFGSDPSGVDPDINPVATNPAFFMDRQANKFLYGLASGLDVIAIWTVVLLAIGVAIVSNNKKLSTGTTMAVMFTVYALLILGLAGIGSAF